jgi:hypothetical protein
MSSTSPSHPRDLARAVDELAGHVWQSRPRENFMTGVRNRVDLTVAGRLSAVTTFDVGPEVPLSRVGAGPR